jgi:TolB-like protein/DNA-binding winged helix-turn-helix (wHTH) protein/tetratricopeptide (TPR) repeat protein
MIVRTKRAEPSSLTFGIFELDPRNHELRRAGIPVRIQEQPLKLLELLAERPREVVSREEIRQALWGNDTYVNFERSINFCVNQIRTALGDDAESPRFVQTVPRRGYRFIAPRDERPVLDDPRPEVQPAQTQHESQRVKGTRRWIALRATGMGVVAIAFFAVLLKSRVPAVHSLAVLPLANLSSDSSQDWLVDGFTEELTTELGRMSSLRVVSRTSAVRFKDSKKSVPEIARELDVDAVIEGSVTRVGDRVRVTAQLIQAATDRHLWANSYERNSQDILGLQNEVARGIARETGARLSSHSQPKGTGLVSPEAYEAYLTGRQSWGTRTQAGLEKGLESFRLSIAKDPGYAPAYAGLADTFIVLGHHGYLAPKDALPNAREAAMRALALDPDLAEAHTSLALVNHAYDWDWPAAEREFKRAIALNPNYATAHHWYAHYLVSMGRLDEALREIRKARELDPFSAVINEFEGLTLYYARRYQEATSQLRRTIQLHPSFDMDVRNDIGNVFEAQGMLSEAIQQWQEALTLSGQSQLASELQRAYTAGGDKAYFRKELDYATGHQMGGIDSPLSLAHIAARLGDRNRAFRWLQQSYEERDPWLLNMTVDPAFDNLRSDPRFEALVRRIGLVR